MLLADGRHGTDFALGFGSAVSTARRLRDPYHAEVVAERRPIRALPALLVNQIAAGEVVERPASVVKELVENAIDAGATRIEVTIEGGGRDLIRVVDDGCGIPPEELPLAVAAHATSKIAEAEDLNAIRTMGFRGEALASIASVSRLRIVSRPRSAVAAAELLAEGDRVEPPRPAAAPPGTSVSVADLFGSVPARRKFLKGDAAEAGRVGDVIEAIALGHPSIAFLLRVDGRVALDLPATEDPRRRAFDVVGREHEARFLSVEASEGGLHLWGLVGRPEIAKSSVRHLRVQLNGRPIADKAIVHAVREAYRGLVEPGRSPMAVLHLECDPREVDVNVHPAKTEVRFRNASLVHQVVHRAVQRALRGADIVPAFRLPEPAPSPGLAAARVEPSGIGAGALLLDELVRELGPAPPLPPLPLGRPEPTLPGVVRAVEILQVHDSFVVVHDEEGILIVDQHALHERVMFEKLLERMREGPLERQRLLAPAIVEVAPRELEALEELGDLLGSIGIEAEPAGPRAVAVHASPTLLFERGVEPTGFLRELLGRAADGDFGRGDRFEASLAEVLDMMACKAAIKAGDRLAPEELAELLRWRERVERSTNCPHGRPTSLRITIRELERRFGRG